METSRTFYTWAAVIAVLRQKKLGSIARIPISQIAHPTNAKMIPSAASPVGQRADFRLLLDTQTLLHVQEFENHYEAQISSVITLSKPSPELLAKFGLTPVSPPETIPSQNVPEVPAQPSNALLNIAREQPAIVLLGVTALGALVGAALSRSRNGAATGAIIGGCAGLAAVGVATAESSPATAKLSKELFDSVMGGIGSHRTARASSPLAAPPPSLPSSAGGKPKQGGKRRSHRSR